MSTGRLEAFSDGVLAILITIVVLELEIPTVRACTPCGRGLPCVLSFVDLGISTTGAS